MQTTTCRRTCAAWGCSAKYAQYVRQRKSQLTIDCDHIEVRFYGDAAVVTGGWTYTLLQSRGTVITHSRWTSMWTRYPTGWKRHVFQNTYVNPDANKCAFDEAAKTKAESTSPSPASTAASSRTTAR